MSKKLWARVGMSCEVSEAEYEKLKTLMKEKPRDAERMLNELFAKKGERDGESYLVLGSEDNPNTHDDFDF